MYRVFCYATWKLFGIISISYVLYLIYTVRKKCIETNSKPEISSTNINAFKQLERGIRRLRNLFITMMFLNIFLAINCVQEYVKYLFKSIKTKV